MDKFDKYYFERCAKIILSKIVSSDYFNLEHKDGPDLQDLVNNKHGVEVRRGISEQEGNYNSFLNDNIGKRKSKDKLFTIAKKRKLNPWISQNGSITAYAISHELQDVDILKRKTISYIEEKMIKLNNNYLIFESNELFVFTNFDYQKWDIEEIIRKINFDKYVKKFDIIYLLCSDILYQYCKKENQLKDFKVSKQILIETKQLAQIPQL